MYQLFFDNYLLHDPRLPTYTVREPDIDLSVGKPGDAAFTIDPDHPYYNQITRLRGTLVLRAGGIAIWRGRVIRDVRDFYLSKEVEAEGLLACLNDSLIPPFNFPDDFLEDAAYQEAAATGNVVKFFLGWVLEQHNSQVKESQRIELGEVTVTDPNNYITRSSSEYKSAMEIVQGKLVDLLGGYLLPDYTNATPVLAYYEELPLTNTQTVEYGGNLVDLITEGDSTATYTAILPVGKDDLTLVDLPDGEYGDDVVKEGRILYSKSAEEATGSRITRVVEWKDVTEATNLRAKAVQELLGNGVMTTQTITVKAADLGTGSAATGTEGIQRFRVGRNVRLNSTPHGYAAVFPLMNLKPNINNPGDTEITLGAVVKTASDIAKDNQSANEERFEEQKMELGKTESAITETVRTQVTAAMQSVESIVFTALEEYVETSTFESYKETISAQLAILSDEISITLTKTMEEIENVEGDLQEKYASITKYFRFVDDGLLIGESNNAVLLRLDNDIIQFLRNNVPQLFIDEYGLTAEQIRVTRVIIGNGAWSTEADGRLTLGKAVNV